ncbi:Glycosyl transferase family 2 [Kandleria vitulina]|uniref:glycosyltransferase n=1 Tax=Kandleria vitulina TaxID=1630 RepID=UPI0008B9E7D6|nr:glycosyltransferase [Kandleria vitulina]SEI97548.1 Glycosyl transferase family 2 [Kandleria vitulina]
MLKEVDILLSVYNPNLDYLKKQLISLNNQTYENIKLFVFDDCIDNRVDRSFIKRYITNFEVVFVDYESINLGYTKAFEKLISFSTGDYIAFCDQDDIWHEDKIKKCVETLEKDDTLLVSSDRRIIDQDDNVMEEKYRDNHSKPWDIWKTGDKITKHTIFTTYAVGMTLVGRGDFIRSIVPICSYTGHDKWALCCASIEGQISFIDEPLVDYRRHGKNVSGVLAGIDNKKDYYNHRVIPHHEVLNALKEKYGTFEGMKEAEIFDNARLKHNVINLFKYRSVSPDISKFELLLAIMPGFAFNFLIRCIRKMYK